MKNGFAFTRELNEVVSSLRLRPLASLCLFLAVMTVSLCAQSSNTIRVNAGGPTFVDATGKTWVADYGFVNGAAWRGSAIGSSYADAGLLETMRTSSSPFRYKFSLANGNYNVRLRFVELGTAKVGERVFDVLVNDQQVLNRFDIMQAAGGRALPYDFTTRASVTNGTISINFQPIGASAVISAIEILPAAEGSGSTTSPVIISPATATVGVKQSIQLSALQDGVAVSGVTWSITPRLGSITSGRYTAPISLATTTNVLAQATLSNGTVAGYSTITVVPVDISINPAVSTLGQNGSVQLAANVTGASNTAVIWSLSSGGGTLSATGLYQAPASITAASSVLVLARSVADTSRFATATINLQPPAVTISVTPTSSSLGAGGTQQFLASVSGSTNTAVSWSVSPAVGSISASGAYTAPSTLTSAQTVTVTATSLADPSKTASASISLVPTVSVSLNPTSVSLGAGATRQFAASVSGSTNTAVTWSLSPAVGTLSSTGLYTAPSTLTSAQTVTIRATSSADGSKSATATVSLTPSVTISLTPATVQLQPSGTQQFLASIGGSTNTGVNWSISPQVGSISASGLYTAPSSVTSAQTVTVTAVSQADSSKSATASISLVAPVTISLSPASVSLGSSATQQFAASVANTSNTAVTWTITPAVGTISASGLYTAPAGITSTQAITVRATSQADASKSATATVNLTPAVTITLSPATVSLGSSATQQFAASVANSSNTAVTWSITPAVGSISTSGLYTAPSGITTAQAVTVRATSSADSTKSATATVNLTPAVNVTMTPATATVLAGATQQFAASVSNSTNTAVNWTLTPAVGSVSSTGLYTAPGTVLTTQTVTVRATSQADATKSATATLTVRPLVAISISTAPASVNAGNTAQFAASITGASNTAVTWAISPAFGSISASGLYTAPASVTANQTVKVTATSTEDTTRTATVDLQVLPSKGITISPLSISLTGGGQQTFSLLFSGLLNNLVTWSISPNVGTISTSGVYTAPATITTEQTITITASSILDALIKVSATVKLTPPPVSVSKTTLPIEVMGPNGTTVKVPVNLALAPSGAVVLNMRTHGVVYATEASVRVNNSAWVNLTDSVLPANSLDLKYGGVGGGYSVLNFQIPVAAGVLTAGTNNIEFRFNETDGFVSGFRVLDFNLQSGTTRLLSTDLFVQDLPATWKAPLTSSADIEAGKNLWNNANLIVPFPSGTKTIQARCSSCHAQDGRDLKYFNYSNNTIRTRAVFHGLTTTQGDQIASYIRSLNQPNPGRPWNPPYQPGPGVDAKAIGDWAAGAGIDSVLSTDNDQLSFLSPNQAKVDFLQTGNLSMRDMPVAMQLLDWNRWLPRIHPIDAYGTGFNTSSLYTTYTWLRSTLIPGNSAAFEKAQYRLNDWNSDRISYENGKIPDGTTANWANPEVAIKVYSIVLWQMVKHWELQQEYNLDGFARNIFGDQADDRAWITHIAFQASPSIRKILPGAPGIGNGKKSTFEYTSFAWYYTQMILNHSNKRQACTNPVDWGYLYGFIGAMARMNPYQGNMLLGIMTKGLQISNNGHGPQEGCVYGWQFEVNDPSRLIAGGNALIWNDMPAATSSALINAYMAAWWDVFSKFTPKQFVDGGYTNSTDPITRGYADGNMASRFWTMIPHLRYRGLNSTIANQMIQWGQSAWPNNDWNVVRNATCAPLSTGMIRCTSDQ